MDVTDIGKVATRKRMNTDVEKLREKVSRESAKIIKLKVAQDTAYWDLKERLQQLQGAHERLQQNMVDVQMQHEAASAHYTQELHLRPDTLNKVAATRAVCDVLEEYGERLRRCVARCRADQGALQAAYGQCGERVRGLAARLERAGDAQACQRDAAQKSAARAAELELQLRVVHEELGAARARADERGVLCDQLAARQRQADEAAAAMRDEIARLVGQFDGQTARMQQTIARHEAEARSAGAEDARLRREADVLHDELRRALAELADSKNTIEHMKQKEATLVNKIKNLEKVINDKSQHEQEMETEISSIRQCVRQLETEKLEASENLHKREQVCGALRTALDDLERDAEQLRTQLADQQAAHQEQRAADAAQRAELSAAAAAKERELGANASTIMRLMADLKSECDARARCDAALADLRRQHDAALTDLRRQHDAALADQRRQHDELRDALQAKDDELGAQMTIILDMRGEKERLQERIQGMQNTIDNVQKLTGCLAAPEGAKDAGEPPELDAGPHVEKPIAARKTKQDELYSFLSDSSVDGDALDAREVGRRFEALRYDERGGRLAPQGIISLSQVKDDMMKRRTFFKNKRLASKPKKLK